MFNLNIFQTLIWLIVHLMTSEKKSPSIIGDAPQNACKITKMTQLRNKICKTQYCTSAAIKKFLNCFLGLVMWGLVTECWGQVTIF